MSLSSRDHDLDRGAATRERLRSAAAELLAERAWSKITLRDITDAAQANVASVGYHFGSKNALLGEVLRDIVTSVTKRQAAALDALPTDAPLPTVVEVWLAPAFEQEDRDAASWETMRRHLAEPVPEVLAVYQFAGDLVERSLTVRLRDLLPHLSEAELRLRHVGVLAATAALTSRGPAQPARHLLAPDRVGPGSLRRAVVAFVCGALSAPAGVSAQGEPPPNPKPSDL
jgi:AcrR family transcriptional regulator